MRMTEKQKRLRNAFMAYVVAYLFVYFLCGGPSSRFFDWKGALTILIGAPLYILVKGDLCFIYNLMMSVTYLIIPVTCFYAYIRWGGWVTYCLVLGSATFCWYFPMLMVVVGPV